jgi:putative flippase GtrA
MASVGKPLLASSVKYGVVGGVMFIMLFVLLYFLKENPLSSYAIDSIMIALFLYFTLKEVRDYRQRGSLTFTQGMTAGFIMYLTIALLSALFTFVFIEFIDPKVLERHIPENLSILTDDPKKWTEKFGDQTYQEVLEGVRNQTSVDVAISDFIRKIGIGLFLTGIFTLFLKR